MPPSKKKPKLTRPWQEVAKEALDYRDASITQAWPDMPELPEHLPKNVSSLPSDYLSNEEIQITEMLPENLLSKLSSGKLTSTSVSTAFLRRAALAQKLTNCVTELLPSRTLARAKYLDAYFTEHKKPLGPLHGLPISVKEHIGMKDLGLNAGYIAWWEKTAKDDARLLKILWKAGAVFHARTTQPQCLMHLETDSNYYGTTVNPYNQDTSAGGSSGGEGALIGMRGSCLGIGTDIGGSIRSPAANNGLYGLKPTSFRIPTDGWSSTPPSADPIPTVIGPLSTSISGISIFMSVVLSAQPWRLEPYLVPIPWVLRRIPSSPSQPLRIAIMYSDGVVQPHPPITRTLKNLASELEALPNVTVKEWKPHLHDESWAIISTLYFPDAGASDIAIMEESGEPMLPLTRWIIKENPCVKNLSMGELWYWLEEREAYKSEYAKVWEEFDGGNPPVVLICPVGPGVAPKHNTAKYWGYTSVWNLLDYPGLVVPLDRVRKEVDVKDEGYEPMNDIDRENWELYDPEVFDGLPVSLQIVGRRFEDEKCIAVAEWLEEEGLIGNWQTRGD